MVGTLPPTGKAHACDGSVRQVVGTLLEVFELFGFDPVGFSPKKTEVHYIRLCEETGKHGDDAWIAVVKYKLAAFRQLTLRDRTDATVPFVALPDSPFPRGLDNPRVLLGGKAYRWLRKQLTVWPDETRESFCDTIARAGRGMDRPGAQKMRASALDTFQQLTRSEPVVEAPVSVIPWADLSEHPVLGEVHTWSDKVSRKRPALKGQDIELSLCPRTLVDQVTRTVHEVFSEVKNDILWEEPFFPSTSANYVQSRNESGAVGRVWEWWEEYRRLRVLEDDEESADEVDDRAPKASDLLPMFRSTESVNSGQEEDETYVPPHLARIRNRAVLQRISQYPGSRPRKYIDESSNEKLVNTQRVWVVDSRPLREIFSALIEDLWDEAESTLPTAVPVPLAEALKVRVITKGPAALQTVLRPLQKKMWSTLFGMRCFRLIGETVSEGYILERMGRTLAEGDFYLSGDYKAATDGLRSYLSEACCEAVSDALQLTDRQRRMFRRALTGHVLENPETGELVPQQEGQLMGSIVSFPILCLVNAAICRWALEVGAGRLISLEDARLCINGDDCLLRTNRFGLLAWQRIASLAGLKPSVGKFFCHREYLNINSQGFWRDESMTHQVRCDDLHHRGQTVLRDCPYSSIPFVSLGLLRGFKRSSGKVGLGDYADERLSIGKRCHELLERAPIGLRMRVFKKFLNVNWDLLNRFHVPWYVPEWCGGLGLPWVTREGADDPEDLEYGPTELDRRGAAKILLSWRQKHPSRRPAAASWQIHECVLSSLPQKPYCKEWNKNEQGSFSKLYGLEAVAQIFTQPPDRLRVDPTRLGLAVLRKNEQLWRQATRGHLPKPLSLDALRPRSEPTLSDALPVRLL